MKPHIAVSLEAFELQDNEHIKHLCASVSAAAAAAVVVSLQVFLGL